MLTVLKRHPSRLIAREIIAIEDNILLFSFLYHTFMN